MSDPNRHREGQEVDVEKSGRQLSDAYPRLLASFGAWLAFGVALLFIATEQPVLGVVFVVGGLGLVTLAIAGSRARKRVYRRVDLTMQWLIIILPIVMMALLLGISAFFMRPLLGYLLAYFLVLMGLAGMAARELRSSGREAS